MSTSIHVKESGLFSRMLPAPKSNPRVAFVSTYPPTMCGLATFTASLRNAVAKSRGDEDGLDVVELVERSEPNARRPEVVATLDPADPFSMRLAADRLSGYDAVILQHEYGIWGPNMGLPVVDLVDRLTTNLITTLHTVLPSPTRTQEQIIEELWTRSDFTVVPTHAARDLLAARYSLDSRSVRVIPHGTDPFLGSVARLRKFKTGDTGQPRLLTWGLIGPGKGLEWSIRAVGGLKTRHPDISYTIAGKTHPKVVQNEGESYRRFLERLVSELGLEENVRFIDEYVSSGLLRDLLTGTGVVVLPYDSTDQIVSGVLVEAIAANVPVVATDFPHAVELAEEGIVSAVPHRDPDAIAGAISSLLESGEAWGRMMKAQRAIAPNLEWGHVAREYERLVNDVVTRHATMSHVSPAS